MKKHIIKINEFIKSIKELIFTVTIIVVLGILILSYFKKDFITCNDQLFQYDVFYREWFRLIKEFLKGNGFPMYSWNCFLGTDYYSSMGYYLTGDLFVVLLLPLYILGIGVKTILNIEVILCIYISAISFYCLLKERLITNKLVLITSSLIYSFGNTAISYYGQYMFHRFYAILPLLFLFTERYFKDRKTLGFIVTVSILFIQSFYFMYPATIFLALYCLNIIVEQKEEIKISVRKILKLIGAYALGVGCSLFVALPTIMYLLNNPRLGNESTSIFYDIKTYCGVLLSTISSSFPFLAGYNYLFFTDNSHYCGYTLFVGAVLLVYGLSYSVKKQHRSHFYTLSLLILCLCIKPLSSIMHGFSGNSFRWIFILFFYLLLLGSHGVNETKMNKTIGAIVVILTLFALIYIFAFSGVDISEYRENIVSLVISFFVSIVTIIISNRNVRIGIIVNTVFIVVSSLMLLGMYIKSFPNFDHNENIPREEVDYYLSEDEEKIFRFYISRENISPNSELNGNMNLDYGFMTSKTYNTEYEFGLIDFLKLNGIDWHYIDITDKDVLTALGTKYWIVYDEKELPSIGDFEYKHPLSWLSVYENNDYIGFGYTCEKVDYLKNIENISEIKITTFVDDENEEINEYTNGNISVLKVYEKNNNGLKGNIETTKDSILFIPIPMNDGWTIYVNGEETTPISVNGGFIGIKLEKGVSNIEMKFTTPYLIEGSFASIAFILFVVFINIKSLRKNQNSISEKRVSGQII